MTGAGWAEKAGELWHVFLCAPGQCVCNLQCKEDLDVIGRALAEVYQRGRVDGLESAINKARDMRDFEKMKSPNDRIGDGSISTLGELIMALKAIPATEWEQQTAKTALRRGRGGKG